MRLEEYWEAVNPEAVNLEAVNLDWVVQEGGAMGAEILFIG